MPKMNQKQQVQEKLNHLLITQDSRKDIILGQDK